MKKQKRAIFYKNPSLNPKPTATTTFMHCYYLALQIPLLFSYHPCQLPYCSASPSCSMSTCSSIPETSHAQTFTICLDFCRHHDLLCHYAPIMQPSTSTCSTMMLYSATILSSVSHPPFAIMLCFASTCYTIHHTIVEQPSSLVLYLALCHYFSLPPWSQPST